MDSKNEITVFDNRSLTNVMEWIKYSFKGMVKEAVDEVITEKMHCINWEDKRLNVNELCQRWNISKNTLHNWEQNGIIKPLPLGGRKKVYSLADIHSAEVNGFVKTIC